MSDIVATLNRRAETLAALSDVHLPEKTRKRVSWQIESLTSMRLAAKDSNDAADEITHLRTALSEAEQRVKDARRVALGDAAEAIFVMGAWSPHYEKTTPNTFDEGTSAAYEIIRELQGKAEVALQSEAP